MSNARLLSAIKLWRQIIWPERKAASGVLGAVFGIFSNIVLLCCCVRCIGAGCPGLGLGCHPGLARCWYRMRQALKDLLTARPGMRKLMRRFQCAPRVSILLLLGHIGVSDDDIRGRTLTEVVAQRLGLIDTKLAGFPGCCRRRQQIETGQTETSSDPRKELANLGVL